MKKFTCMAIALVIAIMFTVPAMAIQADFSGYYRLRGWNIKYAEMSDAKDKAGSESYMRERLRVTGVFKVSDNLSVTTRFDALDNFVFGDSADTNGTAFDFERAYVKAITPIGAIVAGRMSGGAWGTIFGDWEDDADRLVYAVPIDKLTVALTYEKALEYNIPAGNNNLAAAGTDQGKASSSDNDKYYVSVNYKDQGIDAGLLFSLFNYKTLPDMAGFVGAANAYGLTPYIIGKFGDFGIQAELSGIIGTAEFDKNTYSALANARKHDINDHDISMLAYFLEASYNLSPVSLKAGYAFMGGDANKDDDEEKAWGYIASGGDFQPLFILTGWDYDYVSPGAGTRLGATGSGTTTTGPGRGNLAQNVAKAADTGGSAVTNRNSVTDGYRLLYGGIDFKALDNLTIGLVVGTSRADETTAGWSDKHGEEYDLNIKWKIMDNLNYTFVAGLLNAGDYWKKGTTTNVVGFKDPYVFFNELKVNF